LTSTVQNGINVAELHLELTEKTNKLDWKGYLGLTEETKQLDPCCEDWNAFLFFWMIIETDVFLQKN
jgi:hypothetical protein